MEKQLFYFEKKISGIRNFVYVALYQYSGETFVVSASWLGNSIAFKNIEDALHKFIAIKHSYLKYHLYHSRVL